MLVNILAWIIVGGLAGWIASMIMGRNAQMGLVANIVVGIIGGIIGGIIARALNLGPGFEGFNLYSLLIAIVGAVILLFILRLVRRGA